MVFAKKCKDRNANAPCLLPNELKDQEEYVRTGQSASEEKSNFLPAMIETPVKDHELTWKDSWRQIIAGCIAFCIVIQVGVSMGYSSGFIKGLETSENPALQITKEQASWIASLGTIMVPIASILAGWLADKYGRKTICIVACMPTIISWTFLILTNSIELIYVARLFSGFAAGMCSACILYVIEITHPQIRGMMLSVNSVAVSIGILLACILQLYLDWRESAIFFAFFNLIIFCMLFFIPESPYWFICFNNKSDKSDEKRLQTAKRNLKKLNPRSIIYEEEFKRIEETCKKNQENYQGNKTDNWTRKFINYCKMLGTPVIYKPIILLFVIFVAQQLSGIYVVISYGIGLDKYGGMVLLGIIRCIMSIVTAICSLKFGRRTLLIVSGFGMAFSMFFSAMFLFLSTSYSENTKENMMPGQEWILIISALFYISMCSLGFSSIPWTIIGELLPISARGVAGSFITSVAYIMMFGVIKIYPSVEDKIGMENVYLIFGLSSLIGVIVVYIFLPETMGKSFTEIGEYFQNSKRKKTEKKNFA